MNLKLDLRWAAVLAAALILTLGLAACGGSSGSSGSSEATTEATESEEAEGGESTTASGESPRGAAKKESSSASRTAVGLTTTGEKSPERGRR